MALAMLNLTKEGETPKKLSLNLQKTAVFTAEFFWDDAADLDGHALAATNSGSGAKVNDMAQVLSTYNCQKTNKQGTLPGNPDGSFSIPGGGLRHSGDARTGVNADVDEVITIDGSKLPDSVNEVPLFVTIHPSGQTKFGQVKQAGVRIRNDQGKLLGEYQLSSQFAAFDAVQMGSFIRDQNGWSFAEVGVGFNGDFNFILSQFS